jgi:hypothetical protein
MTLKQAIVRKAEGLTRLRTKVISDRRRCRMGLKPRVALASPYSLCGTASDWLLAAASLVFEPLTAESPPSHLFRFLRTPFLDEIVVPSR